MIRVTVELLPHGKLENSRILGIAEISNNLSESLESNGQFGSYDVTLSKFGGTGVWKKGTAQGFNRRTRGPWDLLYIALRNIVGYRNRG